MAQFMELTVDESIDQKSMSNPTWKDIEDGILRIDGQNSSFLILSAVNGNDHLQCVGNKIGLTVEYREYLNNSFKHFRLGNGTGRSPLLNEWFQLECKVGPISILKEELLNAQEVLSIFRSYFQAGLLPTEYVKRNITKMFQSEK